MTGMIGNKYCEESVITKNYPLTSKINNNSLECRTQVNEPL